MILFPVCQGAEGTPSRGAPCCRGVITPESGGRWTLVVLLQPEGSAGPLPHGCLGNGAGMVWLLHLNEETQAALSLGGRGWVGELRKAQRKAIQAP